MSDTISVITACHPGGARWLPEAAESILTQQLPDGVELEWLIQEDSPAPTVAHLLPDDPRIRHEANGAQLGQAMTRNLALRRATGTWVQNLDADDALLPGALATHVTPMANPRCHWAVGQADDLMPDGTRRSFPADIPFGPVAAGVVNDWAFTHRANWPIHCAGLMLRTSTARAFGGWAGLPFDEDLSLFAAISEIHDGHFVEQTTWLYRQHPGQMVRSEGHTQWSQTTRTIVAQRVAAMTGRPLPTVGSSRKSPA